MKCSEDTVVASYLQKLEFFVPRLFGIGLENESKSLDLTQNETRFHGYERVLEGCVSRGRPSEVVVERDSHSGSVSRRVGLSRPLVARAPHDWSLPHLTARTPTILRHMTVFQRSRLRIDVYIYCQAVFVHTSTYDTLPPA